MEVKLLFFLVISHVQGALIPQINPVDTGALPPKFIAEEQRIPAQNETFAPSNARGIGEEDGQDLHLEGTIDAPEEKMEDIGLTWPAKESHQAIGTPLIDGEIVEEGDAKEQRIPARNEAIAPSNARGIREEDGQDLHLEGTIDAPGEKMEDIGLAWPAKESHQAVGTPLIDGEIVEEGDAKEQWIPAQNETFAPSNVRGIGEEDGQDLHLEGTIDAPGEKKEDIGLAWPDKESHQAVGTPLIDGEIVDGELPESADAAYGKVNSIESSILILLNDIRRNVFAADMNHIVWDNELAEAARAAADRCKFDHFLDPTLGPHRQTWAMQCGNFDPSKQFNLIFDLWNRKYNYNYDQNTCVGSSNCFNYKALMWASHSRVGCGWNFCESVAGPEPKDCTMVYCNFGPGIGRIMDERPFKQGESCSECQPDQSCKAGLCSLQ